VKLAGKDLIQAPTFDRHGNNLQSDGWVTTVEVITLGWHNFRQSSTLSEMRDRRRIDLSGRPLDFVTRGNPPLFRRMLDFFGYQTAYED
jgi:hypothetical protein